MRVFLEGLAVSWWEWCAALSIQLAILFAVVGVLDRILRRWVWPRMLAALWLLVFLRVVIPPTLGLWDGPSLPGAPLQDIGGSAPVAAFLGWLAGCSLFGAACLWRCSSFRREWIGATSPPVSKRVADLTREAANRLGLKRLPEVRVPEHARGAAVVGFLRPVVVLPARLIETATREEVGHVLLHELAHVKRRDPLLQLFCLIVQIVFWFHPCIWIARRRLSALTELACDQTVAAALGGSTANYRRTLLRLARPMLLPKTVGSLAFIRRRPQLLQRMEWLERQESVRRGKGPPGSVLPLLRRALAGSLGALVLFCCVPVARLPVDRESFSPASLESLQGCLQLRYAVQAEIARRSPDHSRVHRLVSGRRTS